MVRGSDTDGPVRVAAVDDHVPVRRGLAAMLGDSDDVVVVRTAGTVDELLLGGRDDEAGRGVDVVLLDLHLADGSRPADNVQRLVAAGVDVLVYSSLTDAGLLREALVAGALGVVHKGQDTPALLTAVRDVAAGQPLLTTEWAATLDAARGDSRPHLSERETQALSLYASGLPMKSAARRMDISLGSFREYLLRVRRKYADVDRPATTKLDLYHRAVEDGYVRTPGGPSATPVPPAGVPSAQGDEDSPSAQGDEDSPTDSPTDSDAQTTRGTEDPPVTEDPGPGTRAVRRMTSRLVGVNIVLTSPAWLSAAVAQQDTLFLWWNLLALAVVGVPVVWLVAVSLPVGDVRPPAAVLAGGVALCLLLWPLGVSDVAAASTDLPWLWLILPTTMATLAALGSVRLSLLYGIGVGGLYGVIHTLDVGGDGAVPTAVLEAVLLCTLSVGPAVLVTGAWRAAGRLDALADEAAEASAAAARAAAALDARRELDAVVHDTVLAALHTAVRDPGAPELRQLADGALQTFRSGPDRGEGDTVGAHEVGRRLQTSLAAVAAHADLDVRAGPAVPGHVARALVDAALEAARNSRRHGGGAGSAPDITVVVGPTRAGDGLQVTVADDGVGFDPSLVAPQRMGLAVSVRERMRRVGGTADVVTATGSGTRVRLAWEPAATPGTGTRTGPATTRGTQTGTGAGSRSPAGSVRADGGAR